MSFTVPYHLDPLDYERKAFGPFTSRELKYGGIGIVLAAVVGGALWFAPLSVPELFRVMPAIAVAFPFLTTLGGSCSCRAAYWGKSLRMAS